MTNDYKERYNELMQILKEDQNIDIQLCCAAGSRAYGTADESSDYDFTVVRANTPEEILTDKKTKPTHHIIGDIDIKIYPFNNFIELLLKQNPNLLEIFGLRPDDFFYISDEMKQILINKALFLSKKAASSYKSYAMSCYQHAMMAYVNEKARTDAAHWRKKAAKSMFECLRIYEQGTQLFKTGEIKTCINDSEVAYTLSEARNGNILDANLEPTVPYEDTIFPAFAHCFDEAFEHTQLPKEPDYDAIRKLQMDFNRQIILNHSFKKPITETVSWNVDDHGTVSVYIGNSVIFTVSDCDDMSNSDLRDLAFEILSDCDYDTETYLHEKKNADK